jgi:hypothetical protein
LETLFLIRIKYSAAGQIYTPAGALGKNEILFYYLDRQNSLSYTYDKNKTVFEFLIALEVMEWRRKKR